MSDDDSNQKSNGHSNGGPKGTVLGDNAGVFIPSMDSEDDEASEVQADFGSFIVSLGTSCMIDLGRVEHPETGQVERDLDSAQHTIGLLEMIQNKTQGNLEAEEEKLLESLLHDLRSAFVVEKKKA